MESNGCFKSYIFGTNISNPFSNKIILEKSLTAYGK